MDHAERFSVAGRVVGPGERPFVIGEVAQAHDGSLGLAHAFVDAVADAGADAVKFQTHVADAESTRDEPFRVPFSYADATRYEYWERVSFTPEQWAGLAGHAGDRGIAFLSTPFSLKAVEILEAIGVPAWKIGSGDVSNNELVERVASTSLPVVLSSGMSTLNELDRAVSSVRAHAPLAVLQCTSEYPTPPDRIGLNLIPELADRYGCPVGLSDHSGTPYPSLAAVALGASIVEVHVTLSRQMFGPDVPASVTPEELAEIVVGAGLIAASLNAPLEKDAVAATLDETRKLFTRSLALGRDLSAGATIAREDLVLKKPGTGISPDHLESIVGRTLKRDVRSDALLREDDFA